MLRVAIGLLVVFVGLGIGLAGGYYWNSYSNAQVTSNEPTKHDDTAVVKRSAERATGKPNISATWSALDSEAYPTECGITPTDRYYITQNGIGKTVHDEPSDSEWVEIGCERTSPVNQAEILQQAEALRQQRAAAKANREAAEINKVVEMWNKYTEEREVEAERKNAALQRYTSCWDAADGANNPYGMTQEQIDVAKAKCGASPDSVN